MKSYKKATIVENYKLYDDIYLMKVKSDIKTKPGEFFMLRSEAFRSDPLLSRPFSVSDQIDNELVFLYQIVGKATKLMTELKKGANVQLLGPLGNGFKIRKNKKTALVSGGVGIAPLLYLAKNIEDDIDFYAGFAKEAYYLDEFKPYVKNIFTTSDYYDKKFITEIIDTNKYEVIYACGPNPMLINLCKNNESAEIQVSMEAHMACGIGACLGCTVETDKGFLRVCKDGPVFDYKEVFNGSFS